MKEQELTAGIPKEAYLEEARHQIALWKQGKLPTVDEPITDLLSKATFAVQEKEWDVAQKILQIVPVVSWQDNMNLYLLQNYLNAITLYHVSGGQMSDELAAYCAALRNRYKYFTFSQCGLDGDAIERDFGQVFAAGCIHQIERWEQEGNNQEAYHLILLVLGDMVKSKEQEIPLRELKAVLLAKLGEMQEACYIVAHLELMQKCTQRSKFIVESEEYKALTLLLSHIDQEYIASPIGNSSLAIRYTHDVTIPGDYIMKNEEIYYPKMKNGYIASILFQKNLTIDGIFQGDYCSKKSRAISRQKGLCVPLSIPSSMVMWMLASSCYWMILLIATMMEEDSKLKGISRVNSLFFHKQNAKLKEQLMKILLLFCVMNIWINM